MAQLLLFAYRKIRYTEEENRVYYEIRKRHVKYHQRSLFAGAFPVFVAATISSAVVSIIDAISDDIRVRIALSFVYALFIAQMIGYAVIFTIPSSSPLFLYYFRIATENTAFAYKELIVSIIVKKLLFEYPIEICFLAYFAILGAACLLITVSNAFHMFAMKSPEDIYLKIKIFESEFFSLGLSYTLNVLVIGLGCGLGYLSFLDYTESEDDVDYNSNSLCSSVGMFYAVGLTYLLIKVQNSGLFESAEGLLEEAEMCLEAEEEEEVDRPSISLKASHAEAGADAKADADVDVEATVAEQPINPGLSSSEDEPLPVEVEEDLVSRCCIATVESATRACAPVDAVLCAWDTKRSTNTSLGLFFSTFLGFYVGCAWFAYSREVLVSLVQADVPVLGALVFATVVTSIGMHYMVIMTVALEQDENAGRVKKLSGSRMRKVQIMLMALRLVVGWSWEEVVIGAVELIYEDKTSLLFMWVRAGIKVMVSLVVFLTGLLIERNYSILTEEKLDALRESVVENVKASKSTGCSIQMGVKDTVQSDSNSTSAADAGSNAKAVIVSPLV